MPNIPDPPHRDRYLLLGDEAIPLFSPDRTPPDSRILPEILHFLCPTCGEFWGKLVPTPTPKTHHCAHVPCSRHGTPFRRGGAIFPHLLFFFDHFGAVSRADLCQSLSRPLIEHEARRKIDQLLLPSKS